MNLENTIYAVLGATASGKTDKAIELALELDGEIVNCDSRQIYSEMIIGTASPTEDEKLKVKHHLFNFLSPTKKFSAADYQDIAVPCIKDILSRGKTPILTGGTGFYYSAVADGLGEAGSDPKKSKELSELLQKNGLDFMVERLRKIDPIAAQTIDIKNSRRVLRAIEIVETTGKPFAANKPVKPFPNIKFKTILVERDRSVLHERISKRIDLMLKIGLLDEVDYLIKKYGKEAPGLNAIGYMEWFDYFDGKIKLEQARELVLIHTRQYAKRQCTWFRNKLNSNQN